MGHNDPITFKEARVSNEIFEVIGEPRNLIVPEWYKPMTIFGEFRTNSGIREVCNEITDDTYPKASHVLHPGMDLKVCALGIHSGTNITMKECVKYLLSEGAVLTNVHGLMLAFLLMPDLFTGTFSYKSLDEREMMHRAPDGGLRHPYLFVRNDKAVNLGHAVYRHVGVHSRLLMFRMPV